MSQTRQSADVNPDNRAQALVVEDEPLMRDLLLKALGDAGFNATGAENGREAWRRLRSPNARCDLLITDIFMPEMDGLELLREVRRERPDLPVLSITGGGSSGNLQIAKSAALLGAKEVFNKPLDLVALIGAARKWTTKNTLLSDVT